MNKYINMEMYRAYDTHQLIIKLVIFVLSPFLAFLYSLKDAASRSSYIIYFLFGVIFCWHMTSRGVGHYDDFIGIMERFQRESFSTEQILKQISAAVTFSSNAPKELFENILNWFTKQFSRNYHLYFAFASVLYLTFMLNSLKRITKDEKFQTCFWGLLILALFVLPRDIITVQNPRFTVGFWYNVYFTFNFFLTNNPIKKWVFAGMIILSPFFHSGMWLYVGLFFLCTIAATRLVTPRFCIVLFYISIPFSYLSYDLLSNFDFSVLPLPDVLSAWVKRSLSKESYNEHIANVGRAGFWWIQSFFDLLTTISYSIIPYYLWKQREKFNEDSKLELFFYYFLLLSAAINFIQSVPILGGRYYWFFRTFSIYFWFRMVYPLHNRFLLFVLFACSWHIFRRYLYGGAVSVCVPPEIWYASLPSLIIDCL